MEFVNPMPPPSNRALSASDVTRTLADLDKYAGWLGRGVEPRRVREGVKLLSAVIESGSDSQSAMDALEIDIAKVPQGNVAVLLRKAFRGLRLAMEAGRGD